MLHRIRLVPLLFVSILCEIVTRRIGIRYFSIDQTKSFAFRATDFSSLFFYYLSAFIGLFLLMALALTFVWRVDWFDIRRRITLGLVTVFFTPIAAISILFPVPPQIVEYQNALFGLCVIAIAILAWSKPCPLRYRLGISYLSLPLLLHAVWLLTQEISHYSAQVALGELPSYLRETGEHLAVVGAFAAFLFFTPLPRFRALKDPLSTTIAFVITASLALMIRTNYSETARLVFYTVHMNLPPPFSSSTPQLAFYLVALFFFSLCITSLLRQGVAERQIGYGLALIAFSGYQLQSSYQFIVTLVGLMQILRGSVRSQTRYSAVQHHVTITGEQWSTYLKRMSDQPGEQNSNAVTVVSSADKQQFVRTSWFASGRRVTLRLSCSYGHFDEVELTIGEVPREPASATLVRCRSDLGSSDRQSEAPSIASFSPQFQIYDTTGSAADICAEFGPSITESIHGWLGIWPQDAVQFHCQPKTRSWPISLDAIAHSPQTAPTNTLEDLGELLAAISNRSGIS